MKRLVLAALLLLAGTAQAQISNPSTGTVGIGSGGTGAVNAVNPFSYAVLDSAAGAPVAAGSNYAAGNTITLNDGCATHVVLSVVTISGSGVATFAVKNRGVCAVTPANPVAQSSTSGSGSGATFNLAWGLIAAAPSFNYVTPFNTIWGQYASGRPSLTTGTESTFFGWEAGALIATGNFNTAFGHNALGIGGGGSALAGASNAAFGADALRNYNGGAGGGGNTAIGVGALSTMAHASAALNTAVGNNAMDRFNPSSNNKFYNVGVGYRSCRGATAGNFDYITCLGSETGSALSSASKAVLIGQGTGNATFASGSGVILIGSGAVTVDTPLATTSSYINIENIWTATGTDTASTAANSLAGTLALPNITTGTNADVVCVDAGLILRIQAATGCTISSMRFKNTIEPVPARDSLAVVMGLTPATFYMNDGHKNLDKNAARQQIGLIAEDVARVEPRLALYEPDMQTPKSWHLEGMIAELVGAVQQQQQQIEALSRELRR